MFNIQVDQVTDITCEPKLEGLILEVGDTFLCEGNLTEVTAGTSHTNNATVTGESIYTGKKVTDEDPWNGAREGELAKTGATVGTALVLGVAAFGLGGALLAVRRRPQGSHAA